MKISDKLDSILVNFASGSQEIYIPTTKVDEYEECYEFTTESEGKKKMVVLMKNQIRDISFVTK